MITSSCIIVSKTKHTLYQPTPLNVLPLKLRPWLRANLTIGFPSIRLAIKPFITHDGSMGRTVYLPTNLPKKSTIHVGKYTGLVPWILWVD